MLNWLQCTVLSSFVLFSPDTSPTAATNGITVHRAAVQSVPSSAHSRDTTVSGTLVIDRDTVVLRHVIARRVHPAGDRDRQLTEVLLTGEPVPPDALDDSFALLDAVRAGRVTGVRLEYDNDGESVSAQFLSAKLSGSMSVSRSGTGVRPDVFSTEHITGSFEATAESMDDQSISIAATWSAPVQAIQIVAEPTSADADAALQHPAVKAWQAIESAIHAGDKAALLKVAPAPIRSMADQPDFEESFRMIKAMTPKVSRYLRVTERGDKVIIEAEAPGLMDTALKRGTITMVKDNDGVWWAESMTF